MIDTDLLIRSIPALLRGAWMSLQIMAFSGCLGLFLGILLGLLETVKNPFVKVVLRIYVTFIRGTPMLVQILFVFYVLPQCGIVIEPFWAAALAIGINSGAYVSQIVRSGISGVPSGQLEAAQTLGFSKMQALRYILFPQALRIALPSLGNEMITLTKDSSLASIIGVMELSKEGSIIRSRTYDAFTVLFAVSMIYLLLTITLTALLHLLEKKMNVHVKSE